MNDHDVAGYEHIEKAADLLKDVVDDLFLLPTKAQERAIAQRAALGEDHGDDLVCGCWAAATTATALLQLAGRHMDAVVHLSAAHPSFAPSASVLGRAALEALLRVRWLVDPSTPVEREQRWIALRSEEVRFYKNCGAMSEAHAADEQKKLKGLSDHLGDRQRTFHRPSRLLRSSRPRNSCTTSSTDGTRSRPTAPWSVPERSTMTLVSSGTPRAARASGSRPSSGVCRSSHVGKAPNSPCVCTATSSFQVTRCAALITPPHSRPRFSPFLRTTRPDSLRRRTFRRHPIAAAACDAEGRAAIVRAGRHNRPSDADVS